MRLCFVPTAWNSSEGHGPFACRRAAPCKTECFAPPLAMHLAYTFRYKCESWLIDTCGESNTFPAELHLLTGAGKKPRVNQAHSCELATHYYFNLHCCERFKKWLQKLRHLILGTSKLFCSPMEYKQVQHKEHSSVRNSFTIVKPADRIRQNVTGLIFDGGCCCLSQWRVLAYFVEAFYLE